MERIAASDRIQRSWQVCLLMGIRGGWGTLVPAVQGGRGPGEADGIGGLGTSDHLSVWLESTRRSRAQLKTCRFHAFEFIFKPRWVSSCSSFTYQEEDVWRGISINVSQRWKTNTFPVGQRRMTETEQITRTRNSTQIRNEGTKKERTKNKRYTEPKARERVRLCNTRCLLHSARGDGVLTPLRIRVEVSIGWRGVHSYFWIIIWLNSLTPPQVFLFVLPRAVGTRRQM